LAFPDYRYEPPRKRSLGRKIRVYSQTLEPLAALDLRTQLQRFEDYVHVRGIKSVAAQGLSFACFKRAQFQTSSERLARRRAQFTGESLAQARGHFADFKVEQSDLPYVQLRSHSSQQLFPLFIVKHSVPAPREWRFNTYGLSGCVGVPDIRA
jgi:CRISPR-associated endonuclease Csy4